jgi:hypothetical protein
MDTDRCFEGFFRPDVGSKLHGFTVISYRIQSTTTAAAAATATVLGSNDFYGRGRDGEGRGEGQGELHGASWGSG